jgi:predicted DNA-binding transcriptional regulator YafY
MRLVPEAARAALEDRSYWDQVQEQGDGSAIVTFSAPSLEWAASTALMFGPAVEVLDPPELRRMVTKWAALVVEQHRGKESL